MMCLSIYSFSIYSIYLFVHKSFYPHIYVYIYIYIIHLVVYFSCVHVFIDLSIDPSIHPSIYLSSIHICHSSNSHSHTVLSQVVGDDHNTITSDKDSDQNPIFETVYSLMEYISPSYHKLFSEQLIKKLTPQDK